MDVLREQGAPMHVRDMLPIISQRMGKQLKRANVEGALVRAKDDGKLERPEPSTYALP